MIVSSWYFGSRDSVYFDIIYTDSVLQRFKIMEPDLSDASLHAINWSRWFQVIPDHNVGRVLLEGECEEGPELKECVKVTATRILHFRGGFSNVQCRELLVNHRVIPRGHYLKTERRSKIIIQPTSSIENVAHTISALAVPVHCGW